MKPVPTHLERLVIEQAKFLGPKAAEFFQVSDLLVRQWINGGKRPSLAAVEKVFKVPVGVSDEAEWEGKDLFLCLPQYKVTNPLTLLCILGIYDRAKFGVLLEHGDAFIIHTREVLAHRFMESDKEESLWLDDDVLFPFGNAELYRRMSGIPLTDEFAGIHTANRLRSHNKSIVGGLYFGRTPGGRAVYFEAMQDSEAGAAENAWAHEGPRNTLRPVKWCGTGVLYVRREVFVDIRDHFPHLEPRFPTEPFHFFTNASDGAMSRYDLIRDYTDDAKKKIESDDKDGAIRQLAEVQRLIIDGLNDNAANANLMQGEDQTFGIRAKKAGHPSFVDMGIMCGHVGSAVYSYHNTKGASHKHAVQSNFETCPPTAEKSSS